jgi:RND family efflux transporter MFP subunit
VISSSKLGAVLATALTLSSCGADKSADAPKTEITNTGGGESQLTVAVIHPSHEDLSRSLTLTAEFKPYQEVDVHARVTGYIREIKVDVGDHVKAGDVLAVLEIPEIEEDLRKADAAVLTARQNVQAAQADFEETEQISGRLQAAGKEAPGLIAQQELDTAASKSRSNEANLEAAKERVTEAQAEDDRVKTMISYSTITAPFDAVVTRRYADTGALIQAGTSGSTASGSSAVVSLAELKRLRLEFPVPESAAASVQVGGIVQVEVAALHQTFTAKISRFAQKVDESTRTMLTETDVENSSFQYMPGMYATVRLVLDDKKDALAVPLQCVSTDSNSTVFLLDQNQKIEERHVTLGLETATMAEVLTGLTPDDRVIVGDRASLQPGRTAQAKEIAAANL